MNDYTDFIRSKSRVAQPHGFQVNPDNLNQKAWAWQRLAVSWGLQRGRCALWEDAGLGKTLQQLMWGEQIVLREKRPGLLLCPLGVRQQTVREAVKFGIQIPVVPANSQNDAVLDGLNVTNYEKIQHFDTSKFVLVILDEAQIIKDFAGKTKRELCKRFADTPYRLACSATPAPNDYMELGCHSEFLGVLPSSEMLSRWFINDTMKAGGYRLLEHAKEDFWKWMVSWSLAISRPSDLGEFDDTPYVLPPIEYIYEYVSVELQPEPGTLFHCEPLNATTIHKEKRQSCSGRARRVAEIVSQGPDSIWLVFCDTDYEADELKLVLPVADTVEVRGSQSEKRKEAGLSDFSTGCKRILCTKPEIGGVGLNFQHCCNVVFVGLSYSFERFYQAVRRCWRFGQTKTVRVWIVQSEGEEAILRRVLQKQTAHQAMQASLADAMRKTQLELLQGDLRLEKYQPQQAMQLPPWLKKRKWKIGVDFDPEELVK